MELSDATGKLPIDTTVDRSRDLPTSSWWRSALTTTPPQALRNMFLTKNKKKIYN
jgi:hypothetical protein